MAKKADNGFYDAALNFVKNGATSLSVMATEPANAAACTGTALLATVTISSSNFTGPAAGTGAGRKITVNAQSGLTINNGGSAQHIALHAGTTTLHYVTTCTAQTLTPGGGATVNVPSWEIEIAQPSP